MKRKLLISLPPKLLEGLERLKTERDCTRNRVIEDALWKYIREQPVSLPENFGRQTVPPVVFNRDDYRLETTELPLAPQPWISIEGSNGSQWEEDVVESVSGRVIAQRNPLIDPQIEVAVEGLRSQRLRQQQIIRDAANNLNQTIRSHYEGAAVVPPSMLGDSPRRTSEPTDF